VIFRLLTQTTVSVQKQLRYTIWITCKNVPPNHEPLVDNLNVLHKCLHDWKSGRISIIYRVTLWQMIAICYLFILLLLKALNKYLKPGCLACSYMKLYLLVIMLLMYLDCVVSECIYLYCWEIKGYHEVTNLNIIFHGLVLSRIQYAVSVWGGFLNTDVIGQLNSMLRRG
jgi:hypothetical protein